MAVRSTAATRSGSIVSLRAQRAIGKTGGYAAMLLLFVLVGAPLFWMVTGAFKARQEIITFPPIWWPSALRWTTWDDVRHAWVNFRTAWDSAPFGRFYLNSAIITLIGMLLEVINATMTAYALAFLNFRYKNFVFILILAALMVPAQVTVLPNYIFLGKTMPALGLPNWVNTYQGIIIPEAAVAYGTFLLRQAFLGLPREVIDAGKVDGAGHLRTLWDIVIPMSRPVLVTFALISMVAKWNDYLWPLIVVNEERMRPITVGIAKFFDNEGNTNWGVVMAGTVFVIAPLIAVYIWAQRHIIEGITAGATKG